MSLTHPRPSIRPNLSNYSNVHPGVNSESRVPFILRNSGRLLERHPQSDWKGGMEDNAGPGKVPSTNLILRQELHVKDDLSDTGEGLDVTSWYFDDDHTSHRG